MNREATTKTLMVAVLLGALGVTVKLAMDAQQAEQARKANAGDEDPSEARKREIRETMQRAIHAHRQLDYEAAERILVAASEKYPRVPAVWLNLGICYRSLDKLDAADRAFARVLELSADDWDAIAERATIRVIRGKVDEAFALLDKVPAYKGQVTERLRSDPDWLKHRGDARMKPLLIRHGVVTKGDTSLRQTENVVKALKAHEQSQGGTKTDKSAPANKSPKADKLAPANKPPTADKKD